MDSHRPMQPTWPAPGISAETNTESNGLDASVGSPAVDAGVYDLSALAWVQEELRRSLDTAQKALRRFLKEAEQLNGSDVDVVDPVVLRTARQQLHQGVGALELVGLPAGAALLRASESLVQRFIAKPVRLKADGVEAVERASFALLDYVARVLADKPVSPLALFPQYRALQELAGAERVHPADLWPMDWRWMELPADPTAKPREPNAATRADLEQQLLGMMRGKPSAVARMSEICAGLGVTATAVQTSTLWKLAAAFFEAQALGLLEPDVFSKRLASRLLAQLRTVERGDVEVSERLAQDLLFFCAQATAPAAAGRAAPRLDSVRETYRLARHTPVDYTLSHLGRFDPALIAQGRKRVASAKESWSAVAGGEMHRLPNLAEQFSLVGDSLRRLYPAGDVLADSLQRAIVQTVQGGAAPAPTLAMEVATSVLYLEASLEDGEFDHPDQANRIRHLAARVDSVRQGATPAPLDGWMEDLYRRVSDRQTMGSVVQELRSSLSAIEQLIDPYFRDPGKPEVLIPVPALLSSMRGVLSVLGMDHASHAVVRMRDDVDALIIAGAELREADRAEAFERLAGNLGALGFLIDMLSVQPQMAKSLFVYDAEAGTLSPVMGRHVSSPMGGVHLPARGTNVEARLIEQVQSLAQESAREDASVQTMSRDLERLSAQAMAADQRGLAQAASAAQAALLGADDEADVAAAREQLHQVMADFAASRSDPIGLEPELPARAIAVPANAGAATGTMDDDPEMREVFLEEAREVLAAAQLSLRDLAQQPDDIEHLTALRRGFHTLKGSSRMVGLTEFGEAAWTCEQLFNTRQAEQQPADNALLAFTAQALSYLGGWVDGIADGDVGAHEALAVKTAAAALETDATAMAATELDAAETASIESAFDAPAFTEAPMAAASLELPPIDGDVGAIDADVAFLEPTAGEVSFDFELDQPLDPFLAPTEPMPLPETAQALPLEPDLLLDFLSVDFGEPPAGVVQDEAVPADAASAADPFLEPLDLSFDLPAASTAEIAQEAAEPMESVEPVEVIELGGVDVITDELPIEGGMAEAFAVDVTPVDADQPTDDEAFAQPDDELTAQADFKQIGPLRISLPLFNIYLNEADELSLRLCAEVSEWTAQLHRPIGESTIALAHSLAGSSATVGFAELSQLARLLEHALTRSHTIGFGTSDEGRLFLDAAEEIRSLLHQFAAGFLKSPRDGVIEQLNEHELSSAMRLEALNAASDGKPVADDSTAGDMAFDSVSPEPELEDTVFLAPEPVPADAPPAAVEAPLEVEEPMDVDVPS
ncbi:MAG: hybrid sensor histidine kinase/response regulator, partial [Rhizobacter sp.]|nr:hybrid sensor histidine kinase/response regulator [Rhizobacter sp.]